MADIRFVGVRRKGQGAEASRCSFGQDHHLA